MSELSQAELNQLLAYADVCERDGWYYGNREAFEARHERIKAWLLEQLKTPNPG